MLGLTLLAADGLYTLGTPQGLVDGLAVGRTGVKVGLYMAWKSGFQAENVARWAGLAGRAHRARQRPRRRVWCPVHASLDSMSAYDRRTSTQLILDMVCRRGTHLKVLQVERKVEHRDVNVGRPYER